MNWLEQLKEQYEDLVAMIAWWHTHRQTFHKFIIADPSVPAAYYKEADGVLRIRNLLGEPIVCMHEDSNELEFVLRELEQQGYVFLVAHSPLRLLSESNNKEI